MLYHAARPCSTTTGKPLSEHESGGVTGATSESFESARWQHEVVLHEFQVEGLQGIQCTRSGIYCA